MAAADETGARAAILEAAGPLLAERGVEAVSLREIGRTAGQRNTNAVQYHFGDRAGLVEAVLRPRHQLVAARRAALLDELDLDPAPTMRDLAGALVRPPAAMLEDPGGRDYLRIVAGLVGDPATLRAGGPLTGMGLTRWNRTARAVMPESTLPLHRRYSTIVLVHSELGRRSTVRRRSDHRLFVSDLVDLATGLLDAQVSEETGRLLDEREAAVRGRAS